LKSVQDYILSVSVGKSNLSKYNVSTVCVIKLQTFRHWVTWSDFVLRQNRLAE